MTKAEKLKLDQVSKAEGFNSRAHFFTRCKDTLFERKNAGQELEWPYRFITKNEVALLAKLLKVKQAKTKPKSGPKPKNKPS